VSYVFIDIHVGLRLTQ